MHAHLDTFPEVSPNAYTGRLLGWGTILVLHSNLLEILPRNEVRAIIAHDTVDEALALVRAARPG